MPVRIALFGGTFDPIHNAHIAVARKAADDLALDQILFIPASHPPHKTGATASYEDRYRMVELACDADRRFIPSRLEEGEAKSYSIFTVERVRSVLAPGDELFFLIGADAFAEVESWLRWRDVARQVVFIVVTRPGHRYLIPANARVEQLEIAGLPVSSSEIRRTLATGEAIEVLSPEVANYIRERGLYR